MSADTPIPAVTGLPDSEWQRLLKQLTRQFDEDIAQDVLLYLVEALAAGQEIRDIERWCSVAAKHRAARVRERDSRVGTLSLDELRIKEETGEIQQDSITRLTRDPET